MTSRFYKLPSLNALATFETSARHLSVTRSAEELNVTAGAVSRQIKALEDDLGVLLFSRIRTGLQLTTEGEMLFSVLSNAFGRTAEVIETIRAGRRQNQVTLACTHAFAKCWLMPRMNDFWRSHPEICLNHLISDDKREFRRAEVDLRVRYGTGTWPDETGVLLFRDTIYPIAAPDFAERHQLVTALDLPKLPLLHVDWVDPDWTNWSALLRQAQIPHSGLSGRRFSNFDIALQACQDGHGIAIGWDRLVADLIARGDVVRFTDLTLPAPGGYYLTWNTDTAFKEATRAVCDWVLDRAAHDARCDAPVPGGA